MSDVEESVPVRVFGDDPFTKIVDTLLDHPSHEYTKKELAEVNDMSRSTLYNVWDRLEDLELVEETRKIGSTTMFKLNQESRIAEGLYRFERFVEGDDSAFEDTRVKGGKTGN